ncbi:MAG: hypothetical protein JEZ05_00360 [Tenericutes bacterium]|nr:hypothetical protein [Mycoplasmatota bacterium]
MNSIVKELEKKAKAFKIKIPIEKRENLDSYENMSESQLQYKSNMGDGLATLALVRSFLAVQQTQRVIIRPADYIMAV